MTDVAVLSLPLGTGVTNMILNLKVKLLRDPFGSATSVFMNTAVCI